MNTMVAILIAASQTMYVAKVPSFGCTSIDEVQQLQSLRSDANAFKQTLIEKQLSGQCVEVLPGTLVQGEIEAADPSILRVNKDIDPPGYETPLQDFELKTD
jgi:hypothetical protein